MLRNTRHNWCLADLLKAHSRRGEGTATTQFVAGSSGTAHHACWANLLVHMQTASTPALHRAGKLLAGASTVQGGCTPPPDCQPCNQGNGPSNFLELLVLMTCFGARGHFGTWVDWSLFWAKIFVPAHAGSCASAPQKPRLQPLRNKASHGNPVVS